MEGKNFSKDDLKKKVDRIRKLLEVRVDRGATAEEASVAAENARRMLDQYGLTMEEVVELSNESDCIHKSFEYVGRIKAWQRQLAAVLAEGFDCIVLQRGQAQIGFVGFEPDVLVVRYLYSAIRKDLQSASTKAFKVLRLKSMTAWTFQQSFCFGACDAIEYRLKRNKIGATEGNKLTLAKNTIILNHLSSDPNYCNKPVKESAISVEVNAKFLGQAFGQKVCIDDRPLPDNSNSKTVLNLGHEL